MEDQGEEVCREACRCITMGSLCCSYFPQWQGTGSQPQVAEGARQLCEQVGLPFETVPDLRADAGDEACGIQHYDVVLHNLRNASALIDHVQPARIFTVGGDCSVDIVPRLVPCTTGMRATCRWFGSMHTVT